MTITVVPSFQPPRIQLVDGEWYMLETGKAQQLLEIAF